MNTVSVSLRGFHVREFRNSPLEHMLPTSEFHHIRILDLVAL